MPFVKQIGILVLLAALAAGGYVGWQQVSGGDEAASQRGGKNGGARAVTVETAPVAYRDLETLVEAVGTTRARRTVKITPLATGRVTELGFRAGKTVAAGDVLLRLDNEIQRADLIEAEARLTEATSALKRANVLKKTSAVANSTVDKLVTELAIAEAERARAQQRLLDRTVRAPFAGVVGFSNVELGARVEVGELVTVLDDLSLIEIELSLPENLFGRVGTGQRVVADAAAFPDKVFAGTIETIDSRIDPVSRSFKARALVANSDLLLPAGMFMHVSVVMDAQRALTVPEEAVVVDGSRAFVFAVVRGDGGERAERRDVRLGRRSFGYAEIVDGVAEDEAVVVRGVQKVRENAPVRRAGQGGPRK